MTANGPDTDRRVAEADVGEFCGGGQIGSELPQMALIRCSLFGLSAWSAGGKGAEAEEAAFWDFLPGAPEITRAAVHPWVPREKSDVPLQQTLLLPGKRKGGGREEERGGGGSVGSHPW